MPELSGNHKDAMRTGRENARAVRRYLEAKELQRPRKGRKRTPDSVRARLTKIGVQLTDASPLNRLELLQRRIDLEAVLAKLESAETIDLTALEDDFVSVAVAYSEAKGIGYRAWREAGVEAEVLRRAGIKETRRRS